MTKRLPLIAGLALAAAANVQAQDVGDVPVDIVRYKLALRPDMSRGTVSGIETVDFHAPEGASHVRFTANALAVKEASIDGVPVEAVTTDREIVFALPTSSREARRSSLRIAFSGKPKRGLNARPAVIYSSYFACDWMFCTQDSPGDKALFDLDLYLPVGSASVSVGRRIPDRTATDGLTIQRWRAERPEAAYLFGFAAADALPSIERQVGSTRFAYVDATGSGADLDRLFAETPTIAAFYATVSGLPIPGARYVQVLVGGQEAQEAAGFSLIGRAALDRDLGEPETQWIIAHEMSHQWWGNLVTCSTWQDFWLNEGFATFMTAAWKQRRFGESAYQAELEVARTRLKRAAGLGYDKPLAWDGTYPSLTTRRAVQYSKGALFLDRLRTEVGERAFWSGIRSYTRRFAGRSVRSADFQRSMADASGRDLTAIFAEWVYGTSSRGQEAATVMRTSAFDSDR